MLDRGWTASLQTALFSGSPNRRGSRAGAASAGVAGAARGRAPRELRWRRWRYADGSIAGGFSAILRSVFLFCSASTFTAGACALAADPLDLWVPIAARTAFLVAGAFAALAAATLVPRRRLLRSAGEASRRRHRGRMRALRMEHGSAIGFYLFSIALSIVVGLAVARLA